MEEHDIFLKYFEEQADEVFSMCYEQTQDRGKAILSTRDVFEKTWEGISSGKTSMISSAEHYGKISKVEARRSRRPRSVILNQYGY
jgi:hypothetical protein